MRSEFYRSVTEKLLKIIEKVTIYIVHIPKSIITALKKKRKKEKKKKKEVLRLPNTHLEPVWYVCLKTENCCLKKFVKIHMDEKVC